MRPDAALARTRDALAELESKKVALVARRNDLVVKLRTGPEPFSTRAVAYLAGITNARVTQLETAARERANGSSSP